MKSLTDQIREILGETPSGDAVTHEVSFDIESVAFEGGNRRSSQVVVVLAGPPSMVVTTLVAEALAQHPELADVPIVLDEGQVERLGSEIPMVRDHDGDHPALIDRICRDQVAAVDGLQKGRVVVLDDDVRRQALDAMARSTAVFDSGRDNVRSRSRDWEGQDPCRSRHLRKKVGGKRARYKQY